MHDNKTTTKGVHMRQPWEFEEAACAEVGTNIFFQPDKDDPDQSKLTDREYKYAREVCGRCPHLMECAEWGIKNEIHGMWGGLSPQERARMRTKRRIPITPRVEFNQL
jgi:hypothetical protein